MQRTVKYAIVNFVTKVNGSVMQGTSNIVGNNEKEIQRELNKKYGQNKAFILSLEFKTKLYLLDDDIFFKYATEVTEETETTETETETTEE